MVFFGFCQYFLVLDMKSPFSIQFPHTTITHAMCHLVRKILFWGFASNFSTRVYKILTRQNWLKFDGQYI